MAAATNTPNTRTNRLRGLELAIEAARPGQETAASLIDMAEAFSDYLHTGAKPGDNK